MKMQQPLTWLSVLLCAAAIGTMLAGLQEAAILLVLAAQLAALLEFKSYTGNFQFAMVVATAGTLGAILDQAAGTGPLFTTILLCAGTGGVLRQAFMPHFTLLKYHWVDTGLSLAAASAYGYAITTMPFTWTLFAAPIPMLVFAVVLTVFYFLDSRLLRQKVRYGYQVKVGMQAPEFSLPDHQGKLVQLADFRGKHPVLLVFVRGDWCPGCHMLLRTYERNRDLFLAKGVHVLGIGPDDIEVNRSMVSRIGIGYHMLSDQGQRISSVYGVSYKNAALQATVDYAEGIPLPAAFLVDEWGVVRYVSRPDRVGEFLNPALIVDVLDELPTSIGIAVA
jgi:peroxiredoxin